MEVGCSVNEAPGAPDLNAIWPKLRQMGIVSARKIERYGSDESLRNVVRQNRF